VLIIGENYHPVKIKDMENVKVAIIGQTVGTPTEIYEALHGNASVKVVGIEGMDTDKTFRLTRIVDDAMLFRPPLTRAERRKLKRKEK
jgi:hypothetical protein